MCGIFHKIEIRIGFNRMSWKVHACRALSQAHSKLDLLIESDKGLHHRINELIKATEFAQLVPCFINLYTK